VIKIHNTKKSIAMKSLSIKRVLITAFTFWLVAFLFSCQKENSSVPSTMELQNRMQQLILMKVRRQMKALTTLPM
jgi:hypothetical protein